MLHAARRYLSFSECGELRDVKGNPPSFHAERGWLHAHLALHGGHRAAIAHRGYNFLFVLRLTRSWHLFPTLVGKDIYREHVDRYEPRRKHDSYPGIHRQHAAKLVFKREM